VTAVAARRPGLAQSQPVTRRAIINLPSQPTGRLATAACAGLPPDMFFPEGVNDGTAAKAVCAGCPVRAQCLAGAQARHEEFGIWGGVNFAGDPKRKPGRSPHTGTLPRGVQAMKTAERLGQLRAEHRTLRAIARTAGLSSETARFYLDLLDLDPGSQERVRTGEISPSAAVATVREGRTSRRRS